MVDKLLHPSAAEQHRPGCHCCCWEVKVCTRGDWHREECALHMSSLRLMHTPYSKHSPIFSSFLALWRYICVTPLSPHAHQMHTFVSSHFRYTCVTPLLPNVREVCTTDAHFTASTHPDFHHRFLAFFRHCCTPGGLTLGTPEVLAQALSEYIYRKSTVPKSVERCSYCQTQNQVPA